MHHLNALFSGNEDKEGWHFYRKLAEDQPECIHVFFLAIALLLWSGVKEVQWSTCQREMRLRPAFLQCTIVQSFLLAFINKACRFFAIIFLLTALTIAFNNAITPQIKLRLYPQVSQVSQV